MAEMCLCPRCKNELTADAPEGLCPECLLERALHGSSSPDDQDNQGRSPAPTFVPPTPSELASRFPQLEILALLGQGGMGAVYKARQPKLDRLIAVKVLPPEVARDPAFAERFMREARSLARLNHPNIVTIYDFGEAEGLFYFSMEYVDGKNVRELLEAGDMAVPLALKIVPQVCDALQYAHDEGIVHRDIKPENILLDRKGRVKIADFGLAKLVGLTPTYLTLTGAHEVMGTLYYMAPEQMKRSHLVDHRADVYSLGVVFYEMLTGELPLGRFAPPSHKARVDARLDPIVLRALAREPEHRFQDALAFKQEVDGISAVSPRPPDDSSTRPAARAIKKWPSVAFSIPQISVWGAKARGQMCRDDEALILQFEIVTGWGNVKDPKEVRIPLTDIAEISCIERGRTSELVLRVSHLGALSSVPVGHHGIGHFLISRRDRRSARQFVESILGRTPNGDHAPEYGRETDRSPSDPQRLRMEVATPAVGLLLTGVFTALTSVPVGIAAASESHHLLPVMDGLLRHLVFIALMAIPYTALAAVLIGGAISMMRLKYYPWAVAAAIVAMIPFSAGWLLGLPFGIVAIVVLRRQRVMDAFIDRGKSPVDDLPVGRRMMSFFGSVGRYFIPTFAGRKRGSGSLPQSNETVVHKPAADGPSQ